MTKPKEPRGRVRFLSEEDLDRLLKACKDSSNPLLYLVVILALSKGMRQDEIMNLTLDDIDFQKNRIVLQETKNSECRAVLLVGATLQLLRQLEKRFRNIEIVCKEGIFLNLGKFGICYQELMTRSFLSQIFLLCVIFSN